MTTFESDEATALLAKIAILLESIKDDIRFLRNREATAAAQLSPQDYEEEFIAVRR